MNALGPLGFLPALPGSRSRLSARSHGASSLSCLLPNLEMVPHLLAASYWFALESITDATTMRCPIKYHVDNVPSCELTTLLTQPTTFRVILAPKDCQMWGRLLPPRFVSARVDRWLNIITLAPRQASNGSRDVSVVSLKSGVVRAAHPLLPPDSHPTAFSSHTPNNQPTQTIQSPDCPRSSEITSKHSRLPFMMLAPRKDVPLLDRKNGPLIRPAGERARTISFRDS